MLTRLTVLIILLYAIIIKLLSYTPETNKMYVDYNSIKRKKEPVQLNNKKITQLKSGQRDFPGGAVVKNPPANEGDTGSSPGPGRSHMPRSNKARASQLLSLRSRAREPQLLKPTCLEPALCNNRSHHNETPAYHNEE